MVRCSKVSCSMYWRQYPFLHRNAEWMIAKGGATFPNLLPVDLFLDYSDYTSPCFMLVRIIRYFWKERAEDAHISCPTMSSWRNFDPRPSWGQLKVVGQKLRSSPRKGGGFTKNGVRRLEEEKKKLAPTGAVVGYLGKFSVLGARETVGYRL